MTSPHTPPLREVLLLCWRDSHHPQGGGSERYLEHIGSQLARRGVRVTLRTAGHAGAPPVEYRDGMTISRGGGRLSVYPRALAAIVAGRFGLGPLAGIRPDAIIDTQNGIPFFATLVSRAPVVVLVHHCHRAQWPVAGRLLGAIGWSIESRLSPWVHRNSQYLTVSAPSADDLYALGVDRARVAIARAGADPVPALTPALAPTEGARLCVLSRLVPHKQIEDALAVVAALTAHMPTVHLDIVGDGWWSDRLAARCRELGIDEHVTFHGYVDEATKHHILRRSDIHLMPSQTEGWGLAVVEAAQHAVPTIGYRSSRGLTDSIIDGETGILVDTIDDMVSAATTLIEKPAIRDELGAAARGRVDSYSWSATTDAVARVLDYACRGDYLFGDCVSGDCDEVTSTNPTRADVAS